MNKNIFQDPEILNSPSYLITEQIFNAITHGAGLILAIIGTIYLTSESYHLPGVLPFVSYLIFGLSMIWMYLMSTLYHSLYFTKVKPIFQFFDHSSIFILIAGSFTPFALVMVGGWLGWTIFAVQWLVAIVGISAKMLNHAWIRKYSTAVYLTMGWLALLLIPTIIRQLPTLGIVSLVSGGVMYTIGTLFYSLSDQYTYFHVIWHFFVMLGSIGIFIAACLI